MAARRPRRGRLELAARRQRTWIKKTIPHAWPLVELPIEALIMWSRLLDEADKLNELSAHMMQQHRTATSAVTKTLLPLLKDNRADDLAELKAMISEG